ncbi:MAG: hypothetical protein AAGI44_10860, partial [Pseudomonadota bacterium]
MGDKKYVQAGLRLYLGLAFCVAIGACKVQVKVPDSGAVSTESEAYYCAAGESCSLDVSDVHFDETFVAEPA